MELTHTQEAGLKTAVERFRNKEPYTIISGSAGTGKSTLIKFIIDALNLAPETVAYIAYTGKAAQVLRSKGCPDAMTAHRLLYKSIEKPDGSYVHIPKQHLSQTYNLIVVDEVSMLPQVMWDLLLSHGIHVIAAGDAAQLPPISGSTNVLEHPHIFLDEIMRQAAESEIIRVADAVRKGDIPTPRKGTDVNIVSAAEYTDSMLFWADQVICGKNITRNYFNTVFRKDKWKDNYVPIPLAGDKIICLKNDWDKINPIGDALVNGSIGTLTKIEVTNGIPLIGKKAVIDYLPEEYDGKTGEFRNVLMDWKLITEHEPTVNKYNYNRIPKPLRPDQFDYGYCVTCWKAQGSEYNKVTFYAEKVGNMSREDYLRYLYTGITRAASKLTLII